MKIIIPVILFVCVVLWPEAAPSAPRVAQPKLTAALVRSGAVSKFPISQSFIPRASDTQSYVLSGSVGANVRAALNANGGKMRNFTLRPNETWSFGKTIAPISAMGNLPVVCGPAGCYAGGGWCDLGAMFVRVADQLGLARSFPAHAGVSDPQMPGLLFDEWGDGGDLTITNTTSRPVTFQATEHDGVLTISAG